MSTPYVVNASVDLCHGERAAPPCHPTEEMDAFDQLPPSMREVLRYAARPWAATDLLARWQVAARRYGPAAATRAGTRLLRDLEPRWSA